MAVMNLLTLGLTAGTPSLVTGAASGDAAPNPNGDSMVYFKNLGSSTVVSLTAQKACDQGDVHSVSFTISANVDKIYPLNSRFNNPSGYVDISYVSGASAVSIAVFRNTNK